MTLKITGMKGQLLVRIKIVCGNEETTMRNSNSPVVPGNTGGPPMLEHLTDNMEWQEYNPEDAFHGHRNGFLSQREGWGAI